MLLYVISLFLPLVVQLQAWLSFCGVIITVTQKTLFIVGEKLHRPRRCKIFEGGEKNKVDTCCFTITLCIKQHGRTVGF